MNQVILSVGSNIEPEKNIRKAQIQLAKTQTFIKASQFYRTKPIGFMEQADFLNGAYLLHTEDSRETLNKKLKQIEIDLGRVKTKNKNGPRCIDLDIVVWNRKIIDRDFYERDFIKTTVLELMPDLLWVEASGSCYSRMETNKI
ncbi:MAG: 2-amino-4-hydroxy-6-hydroxymethyldihydropteridine diphosphokinase [Microcoleaceae cyanobacterium]